MSEDAKIIGVFLIFKFWKTLMDFHKTFSCFMEMIIDNVFIFFVSINYFFIVFLFFL